MAVKDQAVQTQLNHIARGWYRVDAREGTENGSWQVIGAICQLAGRRYMINPIGPERMRTVRGTREDAVMALLRIARGR